MAEAERGAAVYVDILPEDSAFGKRLKAMLARETKKHTPEIIVHPELDDKAYQLELKRLSKDERRIAIAAELQEKRFKQQLEKMRKRQESDANALKLKTDVNTAKADAALEKLRKQQASEQLRLDARADTANAKRELEELRNAEQKRKLTLQADVSTAQAEAKLTALRLRQERDAIKLKLDIDKSSAASASAALGGVKGAAEGASGALGGIGKLFKGGLMSPVGIAVIVAAIAALLLTLPPLAAFVGTAITLALGGAFAVVGGIAASQSKRVRSAFSDLKDEVVSDAKEMAAPLVPVYARAAKQLSGVWDTFRPDLSRGFEAQAPVLNRFFATLAASMKLLRPAIQPIFDAFHTLLDTIGPQLPYVFREISNSIIGLMNTVKENPDAFAAMFIGLLRWIPNIINGVTWLSKQWIAFRDLMQGKTETPAWLQFILDGFTRLRNTITLAASIIGDFIAKIVTGIQPGLQQIMPALTNFGNVITSVFNVVVLPALRAIGWVLMNVVAPVVIAVFNSIIAPGLVRLGQTITWVWNAILKPAFLWLGGFLKNVIGPAILWWINNVTIPGIKLLGSVFSSIWGFLKSYVFTPFVMSVRLLSAVFVLFYTKAVAQWRKLTTFLGMLWGVIKSKVLIPMRNWFTRTIIGSVMLMRIRVIAAWLYVRNRFYAGWAYIKNRVLTPLRNWFTRTVPNALASFRDRAISAFNSARRGIADGWAKIKKATKDPVNFVIGTVYNDGIRAMANTVLKKVGSGFRLPHADKIATGGVWGGPGQVQRYKSGGVMPGYTPGRDVHKFMSPTGGRLELSGGETILRPEVTRAAGASSLLSLNAAARKGGVAAVKRALGNGRGAPQRFANGGVYGSTRAATRTPVQRFAKGGVFDLFSQGVGWLKSKGDDILGNAVDYMKKAVGYKQLVGKVANSHGGGMMSRVGAGIIKRILDGTLSKIGDADDGFSGAKGEAGKVLKIARASVGKYPDGGGNTNAITRWFGMNGQPWCAMYISWLFNKAKASGSLGRGAKVSHVDNYRGTMKNVGQGARAPGDVLVYGSRHVNVSTNRAMGTIGGNESDNVRMSRSYSETPTYVYRPKWKKESPKSDTHGNMSTFARGGVWSPQHVRKVASQDYGHDRANNFTKAMRLAYDLPKYRHGGWVGGKFGIDRNLARVTRGEFVVNAQAARDNAPWLEAINRGQVNMSSALRSDLTRDTESDTVNIGTVMLPERATVEDLASELDWLQRKRRAGR